MPAEAGLQRADADAGRGGVRVDAGDRPAHRDRHLAHAEQARRRAEQHSAAAGRSARRAAAIRCATTDVIAASALLIGQARARTADTLRISPVLDGADRRGSRPDTPPDG
ncbi:hypothetical protein JCM9534A_03460 [Catenuloplanes indicus JCM 9534]